MDSELPVKLWAPAASRADSVMSAVATVEVTVKSYDHLGAPGVAVSVGPLVIDAPGPAVKLKRS